MRGVWLLALLGSMVACSSSTKTVTKEAPDSGSDGAAGDAGADAPAATCDDGIQNGSEIAIDCGGGCDCDPGEPCTTAGDCTTGVCSADKCQPASCADGVRNGTESDTDCGGVACPKCPALKACAGPDDCETASCKAGVCQTPTCSDGVKNGNETDADCGGDTCGKCGDGKACVSPDDCQSTLCQASQCVPASCADKVKNGFETDVDCGGSQCGGCPDGKVCAAATDCQSGVCSSGNQCAVPNCADKVKNGDESDVDCGGSCSTKCAATQACTGASDCASGVCLGNKCQAPTCTDSVTNGTESDVDCGGGTCPTCDNGKSCGAATDCASGACPSAKCAPWVLQLGSASEDQVRGVAFDSKGNLVVVGTFSDSINFGATTLTSVNVNRDAFVVKYSPAGQELWARQVQGPGQDVLYTVAVDANDDVYVAGAVGNCTVDGGQPLVSAGSTDVVVAKLTSAGVHVWSKLLGGASSEAPRGLVATSSGVVVAGECASPTVSFGGPTHTGQGASDAFVVSLAGDGSFGWSKLFGTAGTDVFEDLTADGSGNLLLAGRSSGDVSFGGPTLTNAGNQDIVVVKLSSTGSHVWSRDMGSPFDDMGRAVAVDAAGDVFVGGHRNGHIDLGGGVVSQVALVDTAMAKYSAASGSHMWSMGPGGNSHDYVLAAARDGSDFVATGYYLSSDLDFGGGALSPAAPASIFVVRLAGGTGAHVASMALSASGAGAVTDDIAVSPTTGNVVIVGRFSGGLDAAGTQLTAIGSSDGFVIGLGRFP